MRFKEWLALKKHWIAAIAVLFFSLVIVAGFPKPAVAQVKYRFKMATLAPKEIGWSKAWIKTLRPGILSATNNELDIKTYYGGIMGDDEDYIKKMRIGQLQMAAVTGQGAVIACPELTVVELPFLFNNYDEVDYVRDRMYTVFDEFAQRHGFKLGYWFDQDFDQCYSIKSPLRTLDDFRKAKFITWYGPIEKKLFDSLGIRPIPINGPEVPSSLRQGLVDAVIAPSIWVVGSQTYSVFRYVNTINFRYAPALMFYSMNAWNELPDKYHKSLDGCRKTLLPNFISITRLANKKSLEAILKYGLKEVKMDQATKDKIREKALGTWDLAAGVDFPEQVLEQILGYLKEYRASDK